MSTDATVIGMSHHESFHEKRDLLWGRKKFAPEFFGVDLICEMMEEFGKHLHVSTIRGSAPFGEAFRRGFHDPNIRVAEGKHTSLDLINWIEQKEKRPSERDLKRVWVLGSYGVNYGVINRNFSTRIPEVEEWVTASEWNEVKNHNAACQRIQPSRMPKYQVAYLENTRPFLTASGLVFALRVDWIVEELLPKAYVPSHFRPTKLTLDTVVNLHEEGALRSFCLGQGPAAGVALLRGLYKVLETSNLKVLVELNQNEEAKGLARKLLDRFSS